MSVKPNYTCIQLKRMHDALRGNASSSNCGWPKCVFARNIRLSHRIAHTHTHNATASAMPFLRAPSSSFGIIFVSRFRSLFASAKCEYRIHRIVSRSPTASTTRSHHTLTHTRAHAANTKFVHNGRDSAACSAATTYLPKLETQFNAFDAFIVLHVCETHYYYYERRFS